MRGNGKDEWKKTPSDMLKQLIDQGEYGALADKGNLKRTKDKKDFNYFWEVTFKQHKYKGGGYDEATAREACFEKIIRAVAAEYQWDAPPPISWACRRTNPESEFLDRMKKWKRKEGTHWRYQIYQSTHMLHISDIGKESYAALNTTYRIKLPDSGAKEHFGKCRVMDEFLVKFHQLRNAQLNVEKEQHNNDDNEHEIEAPAWAIVETQHGVMNNENRFVKVEPREFVDCQSLDEWRDYFNRLKKKESFATSQKWLDKALMLTVETRPPITVVGNGQRAPEAEIAAIKLALFDLQIACGNY